MREDLTWLHCPLIQLHRQKVITMILPAFKKHQTMLKGVIRSNHVKVSVFTIGKSLSSRERKAAAFLIS